MMTLRMDFPSLCNGIEVDQRKAAHAIYTSMPTFRMHEIMKRQKFHTQLQQSKA